MKISNDLFANKSKSWDMKSRRVKTAKDIANSILTNINIKKDMEIMDFGAGTGLLGFFISHKVSKIVAVDTSVSMLKEFDKKSSDFNCKTESINQDLTSTNLDRKFNGIVSSMTIHHIKNINAIFSKFYDMLDKDGFIAIADLDKEDGTFHSDSTGVYHNGFDRKVLKSIAKKVGFKDIHFNTVSTIEKPYRNFTLFLMIAIK